MSWMNREGITYLDFLNKRNQAINGEELLLQFNKVKQEMQKLTGYKPIGKWYIIFCHGATNLGSLGSGEMLIDLSHEDNSTMENIISYFPHELTHQIMSSINKNKDSTALGTIIGEGFAVYMNQLYWGKKYSLAQNLGYTEQELEQCKAQHEIVNRFLKENGYSAKDTTINKFRARYYKINAQLPGAIGYYIGYKIISAYVKKYGEDSWKDVFLKSPEEIYKLSTF
ncbi:MAG: hypothetical protein JNK27_05825 [Chitinophagaceae bacterium]|nr:hypothetical protein [Chitinophagaceae bacterium]